MKKSVWIFCFLLTAQIIVLFYAHRALYLAPFDPVYWKDRYEHSQWRLPLSARTLGDNGLYAYEGYVLSNGEDPTKYNAEIPPLGKYAIGAVTRIFGNSPVYGALLGLTVLVLLFILSKRILKNTTTALAVTTWFALDPLFVSQWTATMLDSLHLACLLAFFLVFSQIDKYPKSRLLIIAAGIALGIFSAVKYPILSVILAGAGGYYLWQKTKSFLYAGTFLIIAGVTYVLSFVRYFILGHTIVDWISLQKWMFSFYFHSKLEANIGSIWTTLLTNRYQNLFTKVWQTSSEWSIIWTVITLVSIATCVMLLRSGQRKYRFFRLVAFSITGIAVFYTFTTFWTRYLMLILPFMYIATAAAIHKLKWKKVGILCISSIVIVNGYVSIHSIFPTPESEVKQFVYDWENGFFQDMYERFTYATKNKIDRYAFHRSMQQIVRDGEIEATKITLDKSSWSHTTSPQYITLHILYSTRNLGEFSQNVTIPVVSENGLWRIPWEQEYFIKDVIQNTALRTTVIKGKRGTIADRNIGVVAEDFPSSMIWITPKNINSEKEELMLKFLETMFGYPAFSAVNFYHRYSVNSQPDVPVAIAVIPKRPDSDMLTALSGFPEITLTPETGRYESTMDKQNVGTVANTHYFECCSYLYSTTTYDGISGLEQTYNTRLKGENGGSLVIISDKGEIIRTIIEKAKKDGEDVLL